MKMVNIMPIITIFLLISDILVDSMINVSDKIYTVYIKDSTYLVKICAIL